MRRVAVLSMIAIMACEAEPEARADASALDGGANDGAVRDASSDARTDALAQVKTCYSPLRPPSGTRPDQDEGCACTPTAATDYCVASFATTCRGRWSFGADGYCFPTKAPDSVGSCAALKGTLIDAGTCPSGFATRRPYLGPFDGGAGEIAPCCYPFDVRRADCEQAGLRVEAASWQDQALSTRCAQGTLRAFVVDEPRGLCCE